MELLQSIRVGTHTCSVTFLARISVEHFDSRNVIALTRGLTAKSFSLFDCVFPLQCHRAWPSTVQASDRRRSKTPIRHGALGVFPGNGRKSLSCIRKRESVQHRKGQVELLLNACVAGNRKMHLSELLLGIR